MDQKEKCYVCGKPFRKAAKRHLVHVRGEDQDVYAGPDCYRRIVQAGSAGYVHPYNAALTYVVRGDR